MEFNLDNFLSQILYVLSGFLFGIFASRYSVLAWRAIRSRRLLSAVLQLAILLMTFIVFPLLFSTRTVTGSFVYYAVLLLFFSKGIKR
ncbi:MAG: hypothetical protein DBY32_02695 [Phascolarctobacterium sp.]|nr:MAG: hypothetical protein DBY32_02695 [Phascolarctobacterium sp.]